MVKGFNAGKLFRSAAPPVSATALRDLVLEGCADYGLRSEQRRLAQALERGLLRERAAQHPRARRQVRSIHAWSTRPRRWATW